LNPFVVTLRRPRAARLRYLMTDRPAFRKLGIIAGRWRDHAERRRDYLAELHRSGRWKRYYDEEAIIAQIREAAEICDRWKMILKQHRRLQLEPDAPAINRDAA